MAGNKIKNKDGFGTEILQDDARKVISLHGQWRFALDRFDTGMDEKWFMKELGQSIMLPGTLQEQGYGDEISTDTPWASTLHDPLWYLRSEYKKYAEPGNVKIPFLLQPNRHYLGVAWYQRDIFIPDEWKGKRVTLFLERVIWKTMVWLDDSMIGSNDSLSTPHVYDFGFISPGKHRLSIRIDNRRIIDIRPDSHSVSDSAGNTWNGIIGRIELLATPPVWIDDVQVYTDIDNKITLLKIEIGNITGKEGKGILSAGEAEKSVTWGIDGGYVELPISMDEDVLLWDEFNPNLYNVQVELKGENIFDKREVTFGLREISTKGSQFMLNRRIIHMRGTHDAGVFPLTGYTAMDVETWKHIFQVCRNHGLNHVRFHSWCPPEAAFIAADQMGFYLQVECGLWVTIFSGAPIEKWLYEESTRILKTYGNHPSFVLLTYGNEPSGRWLEPLSQWVKYCREIDPRRLYAMQTGRQAPVNKEGKELFDYWNQEHPEQQFMVMPRIGRNLMRGPVAWNGEDYRNTVELISVPIITHEVGQWCGYPNLEEKAKYTGHLKARFLDIFRDALNENGLLDQSHDFLMAAGKLQTLCYKEEIEANMRTPGIGGFQLLDLHDYPGQGAALVGVLDVFWETKGYVTPEEFRCFCNTTVPLARFKKRVFTKGENVQVPVDIYHFGEKILEGAIIEWNVVGRDGKIAAGGEFAPMDIPFGSGMPVGTIFLDFSQWQLPEQYRLFVGIKGTSFYNSWNFWVYPDVREDIDAGDVLIRTAFDDEVVEKLNLGEKVLLFAISGLSWENPPFSFLPAFWNRQMNPKWDRSQGILCDPLHPALSKFPTDFHSDWQWENILNRNCRAINMKFLPKELKPIVQGIDDWNRSLKLGLVFECRVGNGKLMVCSVDLLSDIEKRPAARQLLSSIIEYMNGDLFNPVVNVTIEQLEGLFFDTGIMKKLVVQIKADSEQEGFEVSNLVDGDPNTFWMTAMRGDNTGHPHHVIIEFCNYIPISGLVVMQRQNDFRRQGHIRNYMVQASDDGNNWRDIAIGKLESTFLPQKIIFDKTIIARFLKFIALDGFGNDRSSSLAELAIIYAGDGRIKKYGAYIENFKTIGSASNDIDDPTSASF